MTCHANPKTCELGIRLDITHKVSTMLEARVSGYPVFCATRRVWQQKVSCMDCMSVVPHTSAKSQYVLDAPFLGFLKEL